MYEEYADRLTVFADDLIRSGFIIYDSESIVEDTFDDDKFHYERFRHILIADHAWYVRMRDGRAIEVKYDYDHERMLESPKFRAQFENKIRERYGEGGLEKWKRSLTLLGKNA